MDTAMEIRRSRIETSEDMRAIGDVPYADRNVAPTPYEALSRSAAERGAAPALSFQLKGDSKAPGWTWTYNEYLAEVTRAANMLRAAGASQEAPVALILPNAPETVFAKFAAETAGCVVPINCLLEPEKIAAILRDAKATIVVTLAPMPKTDVNERAMKAVALSSGIRRVYEIDLGRYLKPPITWLLPLLRPKRPAVSVPVESWHKAVEGHDGGALTFTPDPDPERIAAMFHTGGTTGDPKLALHKQGGMTYLGWAAKYCVFAPDDVILCALPMFHVFGAYVMALAPAMVGAHVVLVTPAGYRGDGVMDNWWRLVERWKATFFVAVPTALAALVQRKVDADVSTLRYTICGSAPLPPELFRTVEKNTGIRILEGYGQTEATCVCSANPPDGDRRIGSVGFPLPYTEMRIRGTDPDGAPRDCGIDEIGEIIVKGPHVFAGYDDPAMTQKAFTVDGWLRTGDLGRVDADGYFWITGRAKDLIIRGGHNIDPGMIEDAVMGHPAVAFAGAIGQPDDYSGELPCLYVELNEGASATPEEIREYAAERVDERAASPVYVEIMTELPKTAVGKIFKPDLRRSAIARVYGAALSRAGIEARVSCDMDKRTGLTAVIEAPGADRAAVAAVLDAYPVPWRMAG